MTSAVQTKIWLRRRTVLAAAIAVIALAGAASVWANADPVELKVVDRETGQELRTWRHHGRLFIAGEPGARYGLRLTNHTDKRVLLVLSIDGVNVLTGETAAYDQRGYVLNAHEGYDVNGWRKSTNEIAAFAFAPRPQSYAAQTGRPSDVGVIGIAVFKERATMEPQVLAPQPAPPPEWRDAPSGAASHAPNNDYSRRAIAGYNAPAAPVFAPPPAAPAPPPMFIKPVEAPRPAPSRMAADAATQRADEKLGTAHGAREWSVMTLVDFERATTRPQWIQQIEYDTHDNLVASGVIPPSPYAESRPRPFPLDPDRADSSPTLPTTPSLCAFRGAAVR